MDRHGAFSSQGTPAEDPVIHEPAGWGKSIKKQITLPLFIVLIGTVITIMAVVMYKNYEEAITRSKLELDAMTYAEHMKADITNGISVTNALEEIIVSNDGYINRFPKVARDLMTDVIQSIQIAPGGVVKEIYPTEGNEAGKIDLINDKDRGEISRYARDNHVMTMQGPFSLKQGGDGIAVRNPVYLEQADGNEVFWGFTIVIIRVPDIFSEVVSSLTDFGYDFRLLKTVSPWDMTFEEVSGSGEAAQAADAAAYVFEIGDSQWKLEVSPKSGWYNRLDLLLLFGAGMIVVLLIAGFEYVLLVQSDYRETVKNNEKLGNALLAAQTANIAKTYFLNNMSHDLRTPLNAILGYARLLEQEEGLTSKVDSCLRKIEDSGEHLLSILNNMLDMARMESGEVTLNEAEYFIDPNVPLTDKFAGTIQKKNIYFTQDIEIKHQYVVIDHEKVGQIYINLIENAVKYTPEGGKIHVEIRELPSGKDGYAVYQITVSDNGIGMSEEFQKHLFESFSRERNTTESKVIGTGLGLAIVKKLTDMMDGTIEVESRPGEGSTFRVLLTQRIAERTGEQMKPEQKSEDIPEILSGKRALLAEDNDLNAEIAMAVLEDMGIQTERAEDGAVCVEMLQKAEAGYYDFIIMDIQMPNMDGYEAARKIREMPDSAKSGIPIVALTANTFEEDKKKAFEAGMNGHLAKPLDVSKLEEMLSSIVRA